MLHVSGRTEIFVLELFKYLSESHTDLFMEELQVHLWLIHKEYYNRVGEPFIKEEFEAWQYGPILRSVFAEYCIYSIGQITSQHQVDMSKSWSAIIEPISERERTTLRNIIEDVHMRVTRYKDENKGSKTYYIYNMPEYRCKAWERTIREIGLKKNISNYHLKDEPKYIYINKPEKTDYSVTDEMVKAVSSGLSLNNTIRELNNAGYPYFTAYKA